MVHESYNIVDLSNDQDDHSAPCVDQAGKPLSFLMDHVKGRRSS